MSPLGQNSVLIDVGSETVGSLGELVFLHSLSESEGFGVECCGALSLGVSE